MSSARPDGSRPRRIFWLGAHKVLVRTELARLRALGYEVFNPPYLSMVQDQSAVEDWDRDQPSTLPKGVFDTLAAVNFFYAPIDDHIAELLNHYFDAAVVTILPRWCAELVRVFRKPILFRTYGQTSLISEEFESIGARPLIEGHDGFVFSPHAEEAIVEEADWLKRRMSVVPYSLSPDVFGYRDMWREQPRRTGDILVTAPNIANPFHRAHYTFLKVFFDQPHFRFVGVQPEPVKDPQVLGTLPRERLIETFLSASGYFYSYSDPRVCYLPPIEMMVYGGPVIYRAGSLLARYFGDRGPGACDTIEAVHRRAAQLRAGDESLIGELTAAQEPVRRRYDPDYVTPLFDTLAHDVLGPVDARHTAPGAPPRDALTPVRIQGQIRLFLRSIVEELSGGGDTRPYGTDREALEADLHDLESFAAGNGAGAVPMVPRSRALAALLGVAGEPAVLLQDVFGGPVATGCFAAADLRLSSDAGAEIGSEAMDPVTGRLARLSDGREGYLSFGPYLDLPAGRHMAQFELRVDAKPFGPAGIVDVSAADGGVFASTAILGVNTLQTIQLEFELSVPRSRVEFRVRVAGGVRLALFSITHHPMS